MFRTYPFRQIPILNVEILIICKNLPKFNYVVLTPNWNPPLLEQILNGCCPREIIHSRRTQNSWSLLRKVVRLRVLKWQNVVDTTSLEKKIPREIGLGLICLHSQCIQCSSEVLFIQISQQASAQLLPFFFLLLFSKL